MKCERTNKARIKHHTINTSKHTHIDTSVFSVPIDNSAHYQKQNKNTHNAYVSVCVGVAWSIHHHDCDHAESTKAEEWRLDIDLFCTIVCNRHLMHDVCNTIFILFIFCLFFAHKTKYTSSRVTTTLSYKCVLYSQQSIRFVCFCYSRTLAVIQSMNELLK